jgi:signal transduction histidine kinase
MKLKIKLPFIFLLMLVLISVSSVLYIKNFVMHQEPLNGYKIKDNYAAGYIKIAEDITRLYPDMNEIGDYLKLISENQDISLKLYNYDLSEEILSYPKAYYKFGLSKYYVPVKTNDSKAAFFLEVLRHTYGKELIWQIYEVSIFMLIQMGLLFVILTVYLHYNITKPMQLLNLRLESVNVGRSHSSRYLKRKDEIGELYNHFNGMEERLHQANREQIDMIAAIAHDLKTPLTTINGFVELLAIQKDLAEKEKQEYYALILKKSRHITDLINDFSRFTRDELELEIIEMKPVEAVKLFENIAAEYETELSGLDYELEWKHSFNLNHRFTINEHMIRRVFGNLFGNIVRYGERKDLKVYMNGSVSGHYA